MSPARPRRAAAAFGLALSLGVLTACGGSDDDGSGAAAGTTTSATSSTTTGEAGQTLPTQTSEADPSGESSAETQALAVTSVDFDFEMATTDLQAGEYQISLTNNGDATHDLVVELDGEDVAASDTIGPGESTTFTVSLDAGNYVFYCSVGNHRRMGMEVDVTVT